MEEKDQQFEKIEAYLDKELVDGLRRPVLDLHPRDNVVIIRAERKRASSSPLG